MTHGNRFVRFWLSILLVLTMVVASASAIACGGGGTGAAATPDGTIQNYLNAIVEDDADAMVVCEVSGGRQVGYYGDDNENDVVIDGYFDFIIKDLEITKISETDDEAEYQASFNKIYEQTDKGGPTKEVRFKLSKSGGKWYILGFDYTALI